MVRIPPGLGHRSVPAFLLLALLTLLAACAGSADGADSDERATVPSAVDATGAVSTTTTEAPEMTVEEEVEAAYLEAEQVFFEAISDRQVPLGSLKEAREGKALAYVNSSISKIRDQGQTARFPNGMPESEVLEIQVDTDNARLLACLQDDTVLEDDVGKIINEAISTGWLEVHMSRRGGRWMVVSEVQLEKRSGRHECDDYS